MTSKILSYFPLDKPRNSQVQVLKAIEKAFADGYRNVLLEAPVGSGKSAIAFTVAKYYGTAHILTPRKSLQNQYYEDFKGAPSFSLMKGRNAYPCTWFKENYDKTIAAIQKGHLVNVAYGEANCATGPCQKSTAKYNSCVKDKFTGEISTPCPYNVAIEVSQKNDTVVHNLHSFIFQTNFADRFEKRDVMIIDECHEVEGIIRGFASRKMSLPLYVQDDVLEEVENDKSLESWADWLLQFQHLFSESSAQAGGTSGGDDQVSERDSYLEQVDKVRSYADYFTDKFVTNVKRERLTGNRGQTVLEFIPERIDNLVNSYLLNHGEKRLLMSGTIYNKSQYCKAVGLAENETCFIRIPSSFPKSTRPIYFKKEYRVDTSHALWDQNFDEIVEKLKTILDIFDDVKGLIHAPSYQTAQQLMEALGDTGRCYTHHKDDFQAQLEAHYRRKEPSVFISPICQQGVDFKYDRARFQVILRVPYLNTSDAFNNHKVQNDFPWYNYQALVVFGQQIGRVNRAEDDEGATILMDERFSSFLSRNRNVIPKWAMDSIIYR